MKALVAFVIAILGVNDALGCETEKTARPDSECVVMARAGARGVWFQLQLADELRGLKLELPELKQQVGAYEKALTLRDVQVASLKEALVQQRSASSSILQANEVLTRDARRAREERDDALRSRNAWYRSPFVWFGVGVGTTLLSGYLLHQAL